MNTIARLKTKFRMFFRKKARTLIVMTCLVLVTLISFSISALYKPISGIASSGDGGGGGGGPAPTPVANLFIVTLSSGWNLLSTPCKLDNDHDTLAQIFDAESLSNIEIAYQWQNSQWVQIDNNYELMPLNAVYVKLAQGMSATANLVASSDLSAPPSRDLQAGLNLIGPAPAYQNGSFSGQVLTQSLNTIAETAGGLNGYTMVISPAHNQTGWTYAVGGQMYSLLPFKGYWVVMDNPDTLYGFSTTPLVSGPHPTPTTIAVVTDATWPPFEYVDDQTKAIVGFDIDIMNAIAAKENLNIEFINLAWDPLLEGIAQGTYDCAISSITITEDRKETMLFSDPYFAAGQIIVVRSNNNDITGKDTLTGQVGVQIGTTGDIEVQKIKTATSKPYDDIGLAFQDLLNSQINAVVCDNSVALLYVGQNSGKIKLAGSPFTDESYGIAVAKSKPELLSKINSGLKSVIADGLIDTYSIKWFGAAIIPTITWEQARDPQYLNKRVTVTGPVVAIVPGWTTHWLVSLGKPFPDGFDLEIYDPTQFPADFQTAWIGKTATATGKVQIGQMLANKGLQVFNILDSSQLLIDGQPSDATTRPVLPAGQIYWDQATDAKYLNKTVTMIGPVIGTYKAHDLSLVLGTTMPVGEYDMSLEPGNVGPGYFLVGLSSATFWPDLASMQMYVGKTVAVGPQVLQDNPYTGNLELSIRDIKLIKIVP